MIHLIATDNREWVRASKNKGLRAKPLTSVINDITALSNLVMIKADTLEGDEPLDMSNLLCVGPAGDTWQSPPKSVIRKYDLVSIDAIGWMYFNPKPGRIVLASQITEADVIGIPDDEQPFLRGRFGATIEGQKNLQYTDVGDWICRDVEEAEIDDPERSRFDEWIVRRRLFANTYSIV